MPAFTLDARTREVFGSAIDLTELLDNPAEMVVSHSKAFTPRLSSRDSEVFEIEADIIEIPAEEAKIPRMLLPLQARLSARDLEVFADPEDWHQRDDDALLPSRLSSRDAECFEDYYVKEVPAASLGPLPVASARRGPLSARDLECCDQAEDWVGAQLHAAEPVVVNRRASGRDDEY